MDRTIDSRSAQPRPRRGSPGGVLAACGAALALGCMTTYYEDAAEGGGVVDARGRPVEDDDERRRRDSAIESNAEATEEESIGNAIRDAER